MELALTKIIPIFFRNTNRMNLVNSVEGNNQVRFVRPKFCHIPEEEVLIGMSPYGRIVNSNFLARNRSGSVENTLECVGDGLPVLDVVEIRHLRSLS